MTSLRDLAKPTSAPGWTRPHTGGKPGRPKGSLSKRTIAAIEQARADELVIKRLSLTSLRESARYLGNAMALKQPWLADGSPRPGGDYRTFMELATLQLRYLEAITPYEAPRLAAITVTPPERETPRVATINIISVPSGRFLSKDEIERYAPRPQSQVIEGELTIAREDGRERPDGEPEAAEEENAA